MRNPITTPRIVVSPKAVTLAVWLSPLVGLPFSRLYVNALNDPLDAEFMGLTPDTMYRAYCELEELGAIVCTPEGSRRRVERNTGHWLWAAVAAVAAPSATMGTGTDAR